MEQVTNSGGPIAPCRGTGDKVSPGVSQDRLCLSVLMASLGAGLQVPDVLPDGRLLEHRQTFSLLLRQDGWHTGHLGHPAQAERAHAESEGLPGSSQVWL